MIHNAGCTILHSIPDKNDHGRAIRMDAAAVVVSIEISAET